jgi:hypothetical protein
MKKLTLLFTTLLSIQTVFAIPALVEENLASAFADDASTPNIPTTVSYGADEAVMLNNNEKVVPKKIHEEDPVYRYTIDAIYPQISGKNISKAAEEFNQRVFTMVSNNLQSFKNSVKQDFPHMKTLPESVQHNQLKVDYDIDVINPLSLVSVRLTIESMQAGRAHPYNQHQVLNFDLLNNKELALSDLFKPDAKFLEAIANYSNSRLQESVNEKDKWMISEGTKPLLKNYKNWNIEADAILITFDEYQVAPHMYGPQEVEVPFSELKNLLSKEAEVIASSKEIQENVG